MSLLHRSFFTEYELSLSAWGEGVLCDDELLDFQRTDAAFREFKKEYKRYPKEISLLIDDPSASGCDYFFTGVAAEFLEKLETLKELILPDTIKNIDLTPKIISIFRENDTLIRGNFGSFAEKLANETSLRFRPSDLVIGRRFFEPAQESTVLTLVFYRDGSVCIKEDISSPGSSAGNTFGGTFYHELKRDFFRSETAEDVASRFGASLHDSILKSGKLAAFIEAAKTRGYYTGKN